MLFLLKNVKKKKSITNFARESKLKLQKKAAQKNHLECWRCFQALASSFCHCFNPFTLWKRNVKIPAGPFSGAEHVFDPLQEADCKSLCSPMRMRLQYRSTGHERADGENVQDGRRFPACWQPAAGAATWWGFEKGRPFYCALNSHWKYILLSRHLPLCLHRGRFWGGLLTFIGFSGWREHLNWSHVRSTEQK